MGKNSIFCFVIIRYNQITSDTRVSERKCTHSKIWWNDDDFLSLKMKSSKQDSQQINDSDDKKIPMSCHQQQKQFSCCFCSEISWGFSCFSSSHFSFRVSREIRLCSSHHPPFNLNSPSIFKIFYCKLRILFIKSDCEEAEKHEMKSSTGYTHIFVSSRHKILEKGEEVNFVAGRICLKVTLIGTMKLSCEVKNERR